MEREYEAGYAFITEGDTEKVFYLTFLSFLSRKYDNELRRVVNHDTFEIDYQIITEGKIKLIKFHSVNCISQLPRSGAWFNSQCYEKYKKVKWNVFLCYDTDDYREDISKFYEGDWVVLRKELKKARVLDVAASADIEDIMLTDLEGVCKFLQCSVPATLKGRKGKVKMKNLFRDNHQAYHEGLRAKNLIESLDMQKIVDNSVLPLREIEEQLFKS